MLQTIVEAASNFCKEQLGAERMELKKERSLQSGALVASIELETANEMSYKIYLAATREFVQFVAKIFLDEEQSDDETIMDMALECTNLIVGSAKVIASKNGLDFTISTPKIETVNSFEASFDETVLLKCDGHALFIALQEG